MADIRIKDLTTTASSTASGDFFVIDGTTGTRKVNAFSPSFGGNATVTGTLTVNGTTASVGAGTGSIISKLNGAAGSYKLSIYQSAGVDRWYAGVAAGAESGSDGGAPYSIVALTDAGAVIDNALLITRAAGGSITTPRPVSISATTLSTSTSSGALVVGNGTSGGLGVGGDVNIGGAVTVTSGVAPQFSIAPSGGRPIRFNASTGFMSLQANPGGWYLGVRFLGSAGTHRGNIWAGGTDDALDNINIGDASYSPWLRASSTGISVVAPTALASSENGQLRIVDSSNSNRKLFFGFDNTVSPSGVGYVQSLLSGTTTIPLQLQPLGGGITIGPSPSSTDSLVSATAAGTSGTTKVLAHLENNFSTAALNNAAQLRFKVFNNSVGDGEIAAINGISDSVTPGARTTALSFLTGQQTVGVVERMRISGAGVVSITSSAISSTTSSGALVVSGGLGVGGSANIHNNLTLGYASAGDSVLKIIRSFGGNEWLQIAGWSAGSLGNNAYSIDAVNGAGARPVYFRRSTDAGSTYTNFLTWDTSNNATFDGRITSSTNTDSGVLQLNLVNSSTGTSASSLFRFNAGTRTATLQAYNDTHATLAGQLRVGTSNGDIVLIPSGVAVASFSSANVTFSGDLLFFANSTYDIGTTANRVRQIFVRDIYSTFYTPASATDTGTAGRICYDSNYIYICTATNTWKRAAISTW